MNWSTVIGDKCLYEELSKEQKFWGSKNRRGIYVCPSPVHQETGILGMEQDFPDYIGWQFKPFY